MELRKSHYLKLVHTASNIGQDHRAFSGISEHKGMFGWVDFREDEKKKKKKLASVWLKGREEKKLVGPRCFLSRHTKMFSPKIWEKPRENKNGQKHPCVIVLLLNVN